MTALSTGPGDARPTTSLALPGSRALVVGTGTHAAGSALPDIPAVAATVTAVSTALVERCGLAAGHVTTLTDAAGPRSLLDALTEVTAAAQDVLLFYYVGHGLVSLGGELYLATSATSDQGLALAVDALSYATVRDALTTCRARAILVILDCCFSGRAFGAFGTAVADAFELSYVRGSFLLTAASATEQALAPAGDRYTGLSGALLGLLRDGDPAAPRYLSVEDAYRYLARVLPQRGLPAPHRRVGDRAGDLVLAVNPAAPAVVRPRPTPDRPEADGREPARPCPYPGLSAFTAADARYFSGRDELIADGLATLAARAGTGPVALVGRSGSGKSSVLQAGLLPAVRDGRLSLPGSRRWPQIVLTPGEHPLQRLAVRLAGPAALGAEAVMARLAADPDQLAAIASGALRGDEEGASGGRLLLCVDQFEEMFTACSDPGERRAFVRALCAASRGPAAPLVVVLAIRADFYGHCMDFSDLGSTLGYGQVAVRPMRTAELRAAIEGPAEAAGLGIEDGLPDRLLQDLAAGADADADAALPLLSYALQATWQHSDGRLLTLADYQATGGIWRAVTQRADRTYDELDDDARAAARLLLLSMVRLGAGTDDVRRRVSVADLLATADAAHQQAIGTAMDAFIGARLITVADEEAELTHEALLRAWPRLRGWIEEDRAELLAYQHLTDAAGNWAADGREPGNLYAGARLALARRWLATADESASRRGPLSSLEREFLTASVTAERRGRLRRRIAVATAAAVVVALAASGAFALQQRSGDLARQAEQSSVQLAAAADALRSSDPAGALELSLAAYSSDHTAQARSSLYASYVTPFPVPLPLPARARPDDQVTSVAYSPDGSVVAAATASGLVRLWRVSDPLHPVFAGQFTADAHGGAEVAFDSRGHVLVVHAQRKLELWDVTNPARPVRLSAVPVVASVPQRTGQFVPLAVSPDGNLAATGNGNGRLRLWNITDPRRPVLDADVLVGRTAVPSVAFSADGQVLAASSATATEGPGGGRVRLWDVTDPHAPKLRSVLTVNSALCVAFSPVGHLLVAAGSGEDIHAWNTANPAHPAPVFINSLNLTGGAGGTNSIDSVAFRPDGQAFVTTDTGGDTYVWSVHNVTDLASLPSVVGTFSAAYSPNGQQLVTGDVAGTTELWTTLAPLLPGGLQLDWQGSSFGYHGSVLALDAPTNEIGNPTGQAALWDVRDPTRPARLVTLPRAWPYAEFLPDGRTLVTVNATHTAVRLWSTADPRRPVAGAVLPVPAGPELGPRVAPSFGGHLLAVSAGHGAVGLWDVRHAGHVVLDATITGSGQPQTFFFLTDRLLGVLTAAGLQLWNVSDPRRPVESGLLPGVEAPYATVTYELSSRTLTAATVLRGASASALAGSGTSLWDLADPRHPKLSRNGFNADPDAIAWLNGQTIVVITAHGTAIEVWRVRDGKPASEVAAEPIGSQSNPFLQGSSDNRLVAAGYNNPAGGTATIQVWTVAHGQQNLAEFAQLQGDNVYFAFSPTSRTLVTELSPSLSQLLAFGSSYTQIALYPVGPDAVYNQLCRITTGVHVSSHWQQYLPGTYYRRGC